MGFFSHLFKNVQQTVSPPVNIIGPFRLPAPDDLRWVGKWTDDGWVDYRLGCLRCMAGPRFKNGLIYITGIRITDAEVVRDSFHTLENKYATALHEAYKLTHPEMRLVPVNMKKALCDQFARSLATLNSTPDEANPFSDPRKE